MLCVLLFSIFSTEKRYQRISLRPYIYKVIFCLKFVRLNWFIVSQHDVSRDGFHSGKAAVIFKKQHRQFFVENPP